MGVKATAKNSAPRVLPPTGLQKVRLVWIIDLGTQEQIFKGEKKMVHQIQLSFELSECLHTFDEAKGAQPFMLSRKFTVSVSKKSNTRPFLEGWLGRGLTTEEEEKGFDFSTLLNKAGMANILINPDKQDPNIKYANIASVSPMIKGSTMVKHINPLIDYAIGDAKQWDEFKKIYKALQEKIQLSPEWQSESAKIGYKEEAEPDAEAQPEEEEESF